MFHLPALSIALALCACFHVEGAPNRAALDQARARVLSFTKLPIASPRIIIHKAAHTLDLRDGERLIKTYRIGLGHRGLADKVREGDHLTPEGVFFVCTRNEYSQFHLFLGISYPNETAARRGLKDGLINRVQHNAILRSLSKRSCPLWNTKLGGLVGIHGAGASSDWTWGCIALENPDIEELWLACPIGTPIMIEP